MSTTRSELSDNFFILYGKQYIYSCSIPNKLPSLTVLLCHPKMKYEIQKCVSFKHSEMNKFKEVCYSSFYYAIVKCYS